MTKLLNKLTKEEINVFGVKCIMYTGVVGRWYYQVQVCGDGSVCAHRKLKKYAANDGRWNNIKLK